MSGLEGFILVKWIIAIWAIVAVARLNKSADKK